MPDSASRPLRVFLCHSSGDKPTVRELYRRLVAEGWIDAWLDEEKLFPGQDWNYEIEEAVEAADVILVCLTKNSVTKEGYVQRELRIILDQADYKPEGTLFIIPIRLEECEPPRRLRRWQFANYFPARNRDREFDRLLVSLRNRANTLGILTKKAESKPEASRSVIKKEETKPKTIPETPALSIRPITAVEAQNANLKIRVFGNHMFYKVRAGPFQVEGGEKIDIPYTYFISVNPVNQEEYAAYVKAKGIRAPGIFDSGRDLTQLSQVSLEEAKKFCQWLNESSKIKDELPPRMFIRLPHLREWNKLRHLTKSVRKLSLWGVFLEDFGGFDIGRILGKLPTELPTVGKAIFLVVAPWLSGLILK